MASSKVVAKYDSSDLLILRAVTNLHVGVGAATRPEETVDLPFQRDWMGFPTIYASSLKGAIKSAVHSYDPDAATKCFGPDPERALSPSPTLVTDGYLLFIPARSLVGVYVYLTCPLLLRRFLELSRLTGKDPQQVSQSIEGVLKAFGEKGENVVLCSNIDKVRLPMNPPSAMINEALLKPLEKNDYVAQMKTKFGLDSELVVVKNDMCLNLANKSFIRAARVRLNRKTKTVDEGPWSEEYVPPNTVFFAAVLSQTKSDRGSEAEKAQPVCDCYQEIKQYLTNKVVPVGGKETVGSGLVEIEFW